MWTDSETQEIRYNVIYTYIIFFTLTIHMSLLKSLLITSKNKKSFDIIYQQTCEVFKHFKKTFYIIQISTINTCF